MSSDEDGDQATRTRNLFDFKKNNLNRFILTNKWNVINKYNRLLSLYFHLIHFLITLLENIHSVLV